MSFIQQFFSSRDNNANASTFVGQEGRLWWDPITNQIYSSDGNTPGGIPLAGGGGNGSPGGANGQVQFNQNGIFGGSANLTFDKTTGALTAVSFEGNGSALSNIAGANVIGVVNEATYASSAVTSITAETVTANSQPNITSVGTLIELSVTGNVTGDYFIGNGSQLTGINGGASNTIFNGNSNVAIDTPDGNITITANASQPYTWTFDTSGELLLAGDIVSSSNLIIKTDNANSWISQVVGANGFSQLYWTSNISAANPYNGNDDYAWAYVSEGGFFVTSHTVEPDRSYSWDFRGSDGALISPGKFITPPGDTSAIFDFRAQGDGGSSNLEFGADAPGSQYFVAGVQDPVGRTAEFWLNAVDEGNLNAQIRTSDGMGTTMQWDFTSNGDLILPGDTAYIGSDSSRVSIYSDINTESAGITVVSGSSTNIFNEGVVNIETNSVDVMHQWQFDQTGDLTIPGSIILPDSGSIITSSYNNPESLMANADSNWAYGFSGDGGAEYYTQVKFFGDHSTTRGFKILDSDSGNVWLFNGNGGLTAPGDIEATGSISATGNIDTSGYFVGNGVYLSSLTASNVIGNVANATYATTAESAITAGTVTTAAQPNITSVGTLTSLTSTGNVTGGNINTGAQVVATGNISGGNLRTTGSITATGNIIGGNIGAGGPPNYYNLSGYTSAITVVAPTTGSAIIETVGSTGNAGTIAFGNVNFRQAAISSTVTNDLSFFVNFSGVSNSVAQSMVLYSNLNARFSNAVSAVGNITGGNLITAGQVIAGNGSPSQPGVRFAGDTDTGLYLTGDGNIAVVTNAGIRLLINDTGANITGALNITSAVSATGNLTAGNILTAGQVTANGNITGGNINTGAQVVATGNITGGNLSTAGQVTATGNITGTANITGGNLITSGAIYSNYNTNTANTGSFMATGGNTKGGTGYLDFLVVQNTSGGASNPYKWLRTTSDGQLQIINSAYTNNLLNLTDAGALSVSSSISVNYKQAVNGPAFSAYAAAILQTIPNNTQTKVLFQTEEFDTNSNYTNSRFTPTVEGYYQLNAEVRLDGASGTGEMMIILYKNGSEYKRGTNQSGTQIASNFWAMQVSSVAYANGSTDYFEIYVQQGSGGSVNVTAVNNSAITWFNGCMLRGA